MHSYRNKLLSQVSSLASDTLCVWNNPVIKNTKSDILLLYTIPEFHSKKQIKSLIFRYLHGQDRMSVGEIQVFKDSFTVYKQVNEKPITLNAQTNEREIGIPENLFKEKAQYRIDIYLTDKKPADSNGVVLLIEK